MLVTKNDLKKLLLDYKIGHIRMHTVLDAVEAYSSASNNGKPLVIRLFCTCENYNWVNAAEDSGSLYCTVCGLPVQNDV